MPKFTYPIVFLFNEETGRYNGCVPDLYLFAEDEKLEGVYAEAEDLVHEYFRLATKHEIDFPSASSLESVAEKWVGYKVSLLTANIPD